MRTTIAFFVLGSVAVVVLAVWSFRSLRPADSEPTFPFVPASVPGGDLEERDGIAVLRLRGSPKERGLAHGRLLREAIREWVARVRPKEEGVAEFAIGTCGDQLLPFVPTHLREELEGIAEGSGVTLREVLHLHTRFDLAPFRQGPDPDRPPLLLGAAAASVGPRVGRAFRASDLDGRMRDLVVVVVEESPPLVMLSLPGMAGCFAAVRGHAGGALRPISSDPGQGLRALSWPLLLRVLVESPPAPGSAPAPSATLPSSIALAIGDREVGTLNVSPAGATWRAGFDGVSRATDEEIVPGAGSSIAIELRDEREARASREAALRLLFGEPREDDLFVLLTRVDAGVLATFKHKGRAVARFTTIPLAGP